jgi:hypothetical protein
VTFRAYTRTTLILAISLALGLALGFLFSGCKSKVRPSPGEVTVTQPPPGPECVPSCADRECGQENDGCSGNCDPGAGCYIPTGYCVPDAVTKVCPSVPQPVCKPEDKDDDKDEKKHKDKGDHNHDGHPDNGRES